LVFLEGVFRGRWWRFGMLIVVGGSGSGSRIGGAGRCGVGVAVVAVVAVWSEVWLFLKLVVS
jgi:hypothetical protein